MLGDSSLKEQYYAQLEPEIRKGLLDRLLTEEPDDGGNAYRKELFELRHGGVKTDGMMPDRMLWQCLNLAELWQAHYLFKRMARKEITADLDALGYARAVSGGRAGEDALYREIRNAASRYFKTCADPGYRRVLFGLMSTSERDRKQQMCMDVWKMTEGITQKYGMEEKLAVWNRAVTDQYLFEVPEGRALLEKVRAQM